MTSISTVNLANIYLHHISDCSGLKIHASHKRMWILGWSTNTGSLSYFWDPSSYHKINNDFFYQYPFFFNRPNYPSPQIINKIILFTIYSVHCPSIPNSHLFSFFFFTFYISPFRSLEFETPNLNSKRIFFLFCDFFKVISNMFNYFI